MPSRLLAFSKLVYELLQHSPSELSYSQHHTSLARRPEAYRFRPELPLQVSEMISFSLVLLFHKMRCSFAFFSHSKSFGLTLNLQTVYLSSILGWPWTFSVFSFLFITLTQLFTARSSWPSLWLHCTFGKSVHLNCDMLLKHYSCSNVQMSEFRPEKLKFYITSYIFHSLLSIMDKCKPIIYWQKLV